MKGKIEVYEVYEGQDRNPLQALTFKQMTPYVTYRVANWRSFRP